MHSKKNIIISQSSIFLEIQELNKKSVEHARRKQIFLADRLTLSWSCHKKLQEKSNQKMIVEICREMREIFFFFFLGDWVGGGEEMAGKRRWMINWVVLMELVNFVNDLQYTFCACMRYV